jgi:hypothetical protein
MPSVTTRATTIDALARREGELLGQDPAAGHLLVALVWEGGGIAAIALADGGLAKGTEARLREQLAGTPSAERGASLGATLGSAATIAAELGDDWIGTEHQVLAIVRDATLGEAVFSRSARERTENRVHMILADAAA